MAISPARHEWGDTLGIGGEPVPTTAMQQDDPNAPPMPKFVGKAGNAALISPKDPQWWLAGSNHPYAPFVGNALKWQSYVYDDGTT